MILLLAENSKAALIAGDVVGCKAIPAKEDCTTVYQVPLKQLLGYKGLLPLGSASMRNRSPLA